MERGKRKIRTGVVISDKTAKTRIVEISRDFRHSTYDKVMRRKGKLYAHDENNVSHMGDQVKIMETRPISKLKRWCLVEVLKKA